MDGAIHKVDIYKVRRMMLSVIIPVFNVERYLRNCLDSVVTAADFAGLGSDVEFICVDDGCTDGCPAILEKFAGADGRFRIVRQENQGLGAARNKGVSMASGEWIAFIDSDDSVERSYFKELLAAVRRTGYAIAAVDSTDCDAVEYWCKGCSSPAVAWGKLFRSELWSELRFPVGRLHEDEYTVHEAVFKAGRIAGVRHRLYHYTVRSDSIMHTPSEKSLTDWLEGCSRQAEFLKRLGGRAYGEVLAKKIQVEQWLGAVMEEDVNEYALAMRGRIGNYYWAEHFRHPRLVNRFTWRIMKLLVRTGLLRRWR